MALIHKLVARTFALTRVQNPQFSARRALHRNAWMDTPEGCDNWMRMTRGARPHDLEMCSLRDEWRAWETPLMLT